MEQQKEGIRQEFMLLNWYLKEHLASAVRIAAFIGVFSLLCFLRNVPQDVTVYMIVLMAAAGAAGFCFHYGKYRKHHLVLALLAAEPQGKTEALPEADRLLARDYQQIIASYERQFQEEQIKMEQKYRDMMEYYTMWTHQIKTPIAAMRLLLQEEDTPLSREMQSELFQTEQYVQMALQYLRMEKMTSDLVFARYDLDALIRQAVRKYAPLFIRRKIYYKQVSEGFDDRKRFQIMQKVGMSRKEIRQTIQSQVVTVFFLPLAVAVVHTMVAFPLTRRIMAMLNFPDSNLFLVATAITIAAFAVVYLIVYVLTARAYYKIVE